MQVSAADPKVPSWWNVFRSVCAPAPPEASDPAMVRATWVMAVFLRCRRWWTPRAPRNPAPTKMRFRRVGRPRAPRAWPPQRAGPTRHSGPCHALPGRPRGHPSSRHRPRAPRPRSRGRHDGRTTILLLRYSSVRVAARICDGPLRRRPPLLPPGQPSGPPSGPHTAARRGRTAADPAQRASAAHREVPDRRRGGVRAGCPAVQPAGFLASVRRVGAGADALPPADREAADHRRGLLPDLPGQSAVDLRGPAAARHRPLDHAVRADQPDRGGTAAGLPGLLPICPGSGLRAGRQHLRHDHRADPLDLVPLHHLRQVRLPTRTVSRRQGPNATAPAAQGLTDSRPWRLPAPGPVPQPHGSDRLEAMEASGPWTRASAAAGLLVDGVARPTVFARTSALAARLGAANLGQGFPDTQPPAVVADAAVAAIRSGHNQYPPGAGTPELRES